MSIICGRDGRPMVTSEEAAAWRSFTGTREQRMAQWRRWATKHGLRPKAYRFNPQGQPTAMWDVADLEDIAKALLDKQKVA